MLSRKLFPAFLASTLFLLPTAASADDVNFDEFTSPPVSCCYGSTLTGAVVYPTVTISDGAASGSVMNGSGWNNEQTSGQNLFGTLSGSMNFVFSNPVNNLSFDIINGLFSTDNFLVQLFDSSDTLINSQSHSLTEYTSPGSVSNFSFADSGISRVTISGNSDFAVDTISFNSAVPEPATWAMMLMGFGAMGAAMRRQRKTKTLMQIA